MVFWNCFLVSLCYFVCVVFCNCTILSQGFFVFRSFVTLFFCQCGFSHDYSLSLYGFDLRLSDQWHFSTLFFAFVLFAFFVNVVNLILTYFPNFVSLSTWNFATVFFWLSEGYFVILVLCHCDILSLCFCPLVFFSLRFFISFFFDFCHIAISFCGVCFLLFFVSRYPVVFCHPNIFHYGVWRLWFVVLWW